MGLARGRCAHHRPAMPAFGLVVAPRWKALVSLGSPDDEDTLSRDAAMGLWGDRPASCLVAGRASPQAVAWC